jgi:hypothetical protein
MSTYRLSLACALIVVFALSVVAQSRTAAPVSFPEAASEAVSPNGQFAVVNVDSDAEPHHTLFLENRQTKARQKLMDYERHVEVLWNPNSTTLAVTDYAGSNIAECLLFSVSDPRQPENVADVLRKTIKNSKELAILRKGGHTYWRAVRWTSPHTLVVKVWGHTDENPSQSFEYFHTYHANNGR